MNRASELWKCLRKGRLLIDTCNDVPGRLSSVYTTRLSSLSSSSAFSHVVDRPFSQAASAAKDNPEALKEATAQMPVSAHSGPSIGRRFYKSAYAKEASDGDGYLVMLDHRTLKTPAKTYLKVPSLALAHAIAAEWEYQDQDAIRPFTMPLMKLTSTAIDKVPKEREKIIQNLLDFFHTDAVCCRHAVDSPLGELQAEIMNPLLDWIEKEFGCRPSHSSSLFVGNQSDEVVEALRKALKKTNDWQLAAIDALSAAAKSLVIALAVSRGKLGIEEAIQAIRLEEDFQIEEWGLVEGGHDIDVADLRCRIAAASVFLRLF
ncbi:hypothetical protein KP509_17G065200 [Ceratopteris richardii]|uniref:ATP synthase mitochondrial F1 complex assembly factor 2 n=1 Tax=Ceratopteris richardii TaxID=49495 RepID=A0A8T2SWE8_CERRI|nr:hypothetical protein KP509_17G065200 [Ceratopteris richardii]